MEIKTTTDLMIDGVHTEAGAVVEVEDSLAVDLFRLGRAEDPNSPEAAAEKAAAEAKSNSGNKDKK